MASHPDPSTNDKPVGGNNGQLSAAEREALDARILAGQPIPAASLLAVLRGQRPPEGDLLARYAAQALEHALHARDADAAVLVTRLMDANPSLDSALYDIMNEHLQTEPDTVYALIRARMQEDPASPWPERLRVAALCALHVAITDGDSDTAINWLRLIAREPASFELNDLVHHGLLAAGERARKDTALGRLLIPLALRRDPAVLDTLLDDTMLLDRLADETNLGRVLRAVDGDALQTLQNHGYDVFVMALARAALARRGAMFTPAVIEQAWNTITGTQAVNVPPQYAPETLLTSWLDNGVTWLDEAALQTIMTLALRDRYDEVFVSLAHLLAARETYLKLVTTALTKSARPESDVQALIAQMQAANDLTPQSALDVLVRLLNTWEWRRSALPMVQQIGRVLNQHPGLTVPLDALWQMIEIAGETKDEALVRVATKRITAELESMEDEAALTDLLLRLVNETAWHAPTRQAISAWWRGFVRGATLARLQRIDKVLDPKKALEDFRAIVSTILAFRKMVGKRTLPQFAWDVGVTYGILQALTESFDPTAKRPNPTFDQATMRAELDARADELTPHEQKIMANNLKELAALIGNLGDNRTKASLMRRGDDIDRLLMTGEQTPHSAVDALKWLSGYLSGTQEKDEADEE